MKKNLTLLIVSFLILSAATSAQGVSKLFGLVGGYPQGDQASNGYLFSTDSSGTNFQLRYNFPVTTFGANPANLELALYNGKLYGTTFLGGTSNQGTIFEYDPATNIYTKKYDFNGTNGSGPKGSLLFYNSKFYGLTEGGGVTGNGTIFEWDPATNILTKRFDLASATGSSPQNSLRLYNNKMYGTTAAGGPSNVGVVFQWDPATNIYTDLLDMIGSNGWTFYGNVTVYNNKLYCMSQQGAANNSGALYAIDPSLPNGSNTTTIKVFDGTTGATANNNEMIVYNNKLYGCTYNGGPEGGVLFEVDPTTNTYTKLLDFHYTVSGINPVGRLVANGTKFLGMCNNGGVNGTGTIYEWDPANPATITKKYDFGPNNFDNPRNPGVTMFLYNSKYYGTTYNGGFVDQGTLFVYDYVAGTVIKKLNFNAAENGRIPYGRPTLLNGKIYGTCYTGPQEIFGTPYGTIWEFDPSTSIYSRKFLFNNVNNGANGRTPQSSPVTYNNKLYGTTSNGGTSDLGVLYELDPVTSAFTKKDMQPIGGAYPAGEPVTFNNKLYGMTSAGGAGNNGIIYSYDPATTTLIKLYDINSLGSSSPGGGFVVYNNKLYGTTATGGANNAGVVFSFDPATNIATSLADLSTTIGVNVQNAMTVYNNKMYNTALSGGSNGRGTIFSFDPATNTLSNMYNFSTTVGGTGYDPHGQLTVSGNKMYTITLENGGITKVVEFDPVTSSVTLRSSYTSTPSNLTVSRNGLTVVPSFIANGLPNNCETYPTIVIDGSNNNKWVPILNPAGDVVAELKANGNSLGNVNTSVRINSGTVREDAQHQLYLDRNITINVQNPPSSNVDIRLYIKTSEFITLKNALNSLGQPSGINNINDIAILKNSEDCPSSMTLNPVKLSTTTENYEYGFVLSASINSFSTFFFAKNTFSVLPVDIISFAAIKQNNKVKLSWETENETGFANFEVQKSTDNSTWQTIATVNAKNIPGRNIYSAFDMTPKYGSNLYRLKENDIDQHYKFSGIAKVDFSKLLTITLSPNPTAGEITIQSDKKITGLVVIDMNGRTVKQLTPSTNNRYDISSLDAGLYLIKVIAGESIQTIKLVKQ